MILMPYVSSISSKGALFADAVCGSKSVSRLRTASRLCDEDVCRTRLYLQGAIYMTCAGVSTGGNGRVQSAERRVNGNGKDG